MLLVATVEDVPCSKPLSSLLIFFKTPDKKQIIIHTYLFFYALKMWLGFKLLPIVKLRVQYALAFLSDFVLAGQRFILFCSDTALQVQKLAKPWSFQ